jgi:hypothetical protein
MDLPTMAEAWLRRWLFWGSLAVAGGLAVFLVIAPWLGGDPAGGPLARLVALFGHDTTLRQTSLASAVGLAVTARVFFQPAGRPSRPSRRPPSDVTGA